MRAWEILPGKLWQGDAPTSARDVAPFDVVFLCAQEYQKLSFKTNGKRVYRCGFDDRDPPSMRDIATACLAAHHVARHVLRDERVLVTCMQGRNRSGLVDALALVMVLGCAGREALEQVQIARPNALTNPAFARFLREDVLGPMQRNRKPTATILSPTVVFAEE